jgi:hypothetical protein
VSSAHCQVRIILLLIWVLAASEQHYIIHTKSGRYCGGSHCASVAHWLGWAYVGCQVGWAWFSLAVPASIQTCVSGRAARCFLCSRCCLSPGGVTVVACHCLCPSDDAGLSPRSCGHQATSLAGVSLSVHLAALLCRFSMHVLFQVGGATSTLLAQCSMLCGLGLAGF